MANPAVVLLVSQAANLYGSERSLLSLIEYKPPDIVPIVVTASAGPLHGELNRMGVEVVPFDFNRFTFFSNPFWHWTFFWSFVRILKTRRPDAVIIGYEGNVFLLVAACQCCRVPVFRLLQRAVRPAAGARSFCGFVVDRVAFLLCSGVFCASPVMEQQLRQYCSFAGRPRTLISRLPIRSTTPTTKPQGEYRALWNIPAGNNVIGQFSRLHPVKGVETFLRAAKIVINERRDVCFVVGGDSDGSPGGAAYKQYLCNLVEELELSQHVRLLGFVADVFSAISACDIIALPSSSEGAPISCLETLILRRPIVGSNVDGLGEIIKSSKGGMLIEPGDHVALASAFFELLADPARCHELGCKGRDWVLQNCSPVEFGRVIWGHVFRQRQCE